MFEDRWLSTPVDRIECRLVGDFELAKAVETNRKSIWASTSSRHPEAFDGTLLRMADHRIECGQLTISAQKTCYSAYLATRHPEFDDEYPDAARADPLGMTVVVLTADDCAIVTRRSLTAEQNPGGLYFVGGYAEPNGSKTVDLFQEAAREIAEEIAVSDLIRSASYAIGLSYDPVFCHPEMFLLTVSRSTATQVLDGAGNAPDRNEAAHLYAYPLDDILNGDSALADAPKTWSFLKARAFLARHFEA
ncbi:hypothetical protein SAMN05892877_105263 [Rhizobium subbaraonis]|uniref:Nudix hydrolase domain-containing protein n=1 Tax=Rhizobium subbaraonis TaxID=908946 RepID=A0A285UAS4_9HYPH|nr:hypothetical protein [Rhizobium subbaraonis]SOC38787.1 hypothetical protein SAMN05892877_105263 [Rhizobium subbaraonis]